MIVLTFYLFKFKNFFLDNWSEKINLKRKFIMFEITITTYIIIESGLLGKKFQNCKYFTVLYSIKYYKQIPTKHLSLLIFYLQHLRVVNTHSIIFHVLSTIKFSLFVLSTIFYVVNTRNFMYCQGSKVVNHQNLLLPSLKYDPP